VALAVVARQLIEGLFGQAMSDLDLAHQSMHVAENLVEVPRKRESKAG
jgi:hypothetical protein